MLISVIVPIYNSINYLRKCVDSIIMQIYQKIEIILVDDGSTDGSEMICDEYAKQDKRIIVIHKRNGGLVSARQEGIQNATGEFICWVDSDDWIESDYILNFVRLQRSTNADVVAVSHYHDIGEDSKIIKNGIENGLYSMEEVMDTLLFTGVFFEYGINPHLVTKMFKTEIIKDAECNVNRFIIAGEDAAATYPALLNCRKIYVSDTVGYHYVQHSKSLTKVMDDKEEERINTLISYLDKEFQKKGLQNIFAHQLNIYHKYLMTLRKIEVFDDSEKILVPYGGICKNQKVIIYGAGVLGQAIYKYITREKIIVVAWVDKSFQKYRNEGFEVDSTEILQNFDIDYDVVIIANISQKCADQIRDTLLSYGIPGSKIIWLTKDFLE